MSKPRVPESAKGGEVLLGRGKPVTWASVHGCDGCTTTIGVAGFGKAKASSVVHECSKPMLTAARCCK